ncbi:peptidase inhibitor family I36 protein [Shimazuella kribbensis]|uniref:peptidase inhibitor family I36 protein n=1 Tax=Shimazuella kribbensis TaxID=139808 RepID=UPI0003F6F2B8|nr:peptidase inhibitor family I36 protein [Shimazuella kribbensis]
MKKAIVSVLSLTLLAAFSLPTASFAAPTKTCVTLYEHINFKGKHKTFCGTHKYVGNDWNDKASSAKFTIKSGEALSLLEHRISGGHNGGLYKNKSGQVANFKNINGYNFNDKLSAIRVEKL